MTAAPPPSRARHRARHAASWSRRASRWVRHYARTPKGLLTLFLILLLVVAGRVEGPALVGPKVLSALGAAVLLELPLARWRGRRWAFPSGAIVTGLIVAMVLSPFEPWHVFASTSAIAIASKQLFRTRSANVFNPAALGLVAAYYLFDPGQSWWGALTAIEPVAASTLLVTIGAVMAHRVNKLPLLLAFLSSYVLVFTVAAFAGDPASVADVFVAPDLYALLFFAGLILTDPPTSPTRSLPQVACGAVVAAASFAVFTWVGAAHYLLSGVLAGNALEAWRRRRLVR